MSKLTESQIKILKNYYVRSFDTWEAWGDLYDAVERHCNKRKYYIYRALCKRMGTILEYYDNEFVCKINSKKNYSLFNEINRNCYITILKRTKTPKPLNRKYDDEIVTKFIVHK